MARVMLSTADNPYDPFTQYTQWVGYDRIQHEKNSCSYTSNTLLADFAPTCPEETKDDAERITEDAVDQILALNLPIFNPFTGEASKYVKVYDRKKIKKNRKRIEKE